MHLPAHCTNRSEGWTDYAVATLTYFDHIQPMHQLSIAAKDVANKKYDLTRQIEDVIGNGKMLVV